MIWTPPKKEMKGRKRGSWAEAREQAKAGRWETVCYTPEYICRRSEKRTGDIEGFRLTGVRPWRALWGKNKFLLHVIHEVPLENVKTEKCHDQICNLQRSLWWQGREWILLSAVENMETTYCCRSESGKRARAWKNELLRERRFWEIIAAHKPILFGMVRFVVAYLSESTDLWGREIEAQ